MLERGRLVVGGGERAVRLHREPAVGEATVVREHHDQALWRRDSGPLCLRGTFRNGAQERCSDGGSAEATEKESAIHVVVHGRLSFSVANGSQTEGICLGEIGE